MAAGRFALPLEHFPEAVDDVAPLLGRRWRLDRLLQFDGRAAVPRARLPMLALPGHSARSSNPGPQAQENTPSSTSEDPVLNSPGARYACAVWSRLDSSPSRRRRSSRTRARSQHSSARTPRRRCQPDLRSWPDCTDGRVGLAREIEAQVIEYGRPAPLASLLDVMRRDADQIARGFGLFATTLDQMRRRVLAGSWSTPEVSDVVRAQAQLGGLYFEQLSTLVDRLRVVGEQAVRYFDAAFARVEADPAWNEKLREAFGPDGKPRGVRIAELPDDVDG